MKNILVALEFDDKATEILAKAEEFAHTFKAKLWLLHVAAPDPDFVGYEPGPQSTRDWRADELKHEHKSLDQSAQILRDHGIDAESLLIPGVTTEVLLGKSKELDIDLIIMGHNHHSFLYKAFFGSNAAHVIKKTETPVLIIP